MSRSHLHFREFTRIYEMLQLAVTYSRIVASHRIASTSSGGIKKTGAERKGRKRRASPALTIFPPRGAEREGVGWGGGGGRATSRARITAAVARL